MPELRGERIPQTQIEASVRDIAGFYHVTGAGVQKAAESPVYLVTPEEQLANVIQMIAGARGLPPPAQTLITGSEQRAAVTSVLIDTNKPMEPVPDWKINEFVKKYKMASGITFEGFVLINKTSFMPQKEAIIHEIIHLLSIKNSTAQGSGFGELNNKGRGLTEAVTELLRFGRLFPQMSANELSSKWLPRSKEDDNLPYEAARRYLASLLKFDTNPPIAVQEIADLYFHPTKTPAEKRGDLKETVLKRIPRNNDGSFPKDEFYTTPQEYFDTLVSPDATFLLS